tara:strand:+ start:614 stop:1474 length:861 start_codon:yes stop_codon:yes gene_type:complete
MKIAAIDIGTNAIKSKVFRTTPTSIEFVDGIRSPIRLGSDVFSHGFLQDSKLKTLVKTLKKYQSNFEESNIKMYEIIATSAFRNTQNSEEARRYVENRIEHPIRIISGLEEAKLIRFHPKAQSKKQKVFVDVGGGSTEIYINNDDQHVIQSFQLGAVRGMFGQNKPAEWVRLKKWIKKQPKVKKMIGLGGNIRAFLKICNTNMIITSDFKCHSMELEKLTTHEKIEKHNLAMDRADVIDNALKIYLEIAKILEVKNIESTRWGVADSIAVKIFHELYSSKISIFSE